MLVVAGTSDDSTPIVPNVTRLWDLSVGSPAYRVDLVDGEHQTFTDLCEYLRFLPTLPEEPPAFVLDTIADFVCTTCEPEAMDDVRATQITTSYAVEFLDQVFQGGDGIFSVPPDDVVFERR